MAIKSSPPEPASEDFFPAAKYADNIRNCPQCGLVTLKGMPGGKDSRCQNCGYKDPCCYD